MALLAACVLLAAASSAAGKNEIKYSKLGGNVTLQPSGVSGRITSVLWKHNEDQVAEWIEGKVELEFYGILKEHGAMTTNDGVLQISRMADKHQGIYKVEINSDLQPDGFQVKFLKDLPKPEVVVRPLTCSQTSESCTLMCHGDTDGVGPLTYSWKRGEGEWTDGLAEITIKPDEVPRPETYTCRMKNPLDAMDSDPFRDPFKALGKSHDVAIPVVSSLVPILALCVGLGLAYHFRNREPLKGWLVGLGVMKPNEVGTPEEMNKVASGSENGAAGSEDA